MTRDDALQLLGLSEADDPGGIRQAIGARQGDLAQRIASAPTPALREKYEQQAERVRQARDLLLGDHHPRNDPDPLTLTQGRDLPRRDPGALTSGTAAPAGPEDDTAGLGLSPGRRLAERFEVRAHLGSGGMGAVYAAFDRLRKEEIALKVLLPHLRVDPTARERFLNEARIASNLSHPHIVRVYDVHQTEHFTFLTMERLRGRSLRDEIARRAEKSERFTVEEVRGVAGPLCDALQYAHRFTVHRDIKPENIWLSDDGTVKLMDFGIARLLRPSQLTSTAMALGTAYYMAPEQLRGQDVDHRADQFALGVVLYELLTGQVPVGAIEPPHEVRRSIPKPLSGAVMKALAGDPGKRHADMAALGRALATRPATGTWMPARGAAIASVASLAIALTAAFVVWQAWGSRAGLDGGASLPSVSDPQPQATDAGRLPVRVASSPAEPKLDDRPRAPAPQATDAGRQPARVASPAAEPKRDHRPRPDPEEIARSIGLKLVLIHPGEVMMGSPEGEGDSDEHPQHRVRITRPFYLGVYEVTQAQYEAVMGANPSWFSPNGEGKEKIAGLSTDRHPVETVSWLDAVRFCNKLSEKEGHQPFYQIDGETVRDPDWHGEGFRLPTEAEWEYACRAGSTTRFSFGDDENSLGQYAWYEANSNGQTHRVGEKEPNAFGLYDMHGNVWEWCWDRYAEDYYKRSLVDDPRGDEQASARVYRGGGWANEPRRVRSAYRRGRGPEFRLNGLGFRLARVQSVR